MRRHAQLLNLFWLIITAVTKRCTVEPSAAVLRILLELGSARCSEQNTELTPCFKPYCIFQHLAKYMWKYCFVGFYSVYIDRFLVSFAKYALMGKGVFVIPKP